MRTPGGRSSSPSKDQLAEGFIMREMAMHA
jgi:hypothetical protein